MFNFLKLFKKKPVEEELRPADDINASITYLVGGDGVPRIDVQIKDYEQETISNLIDLLITLGSEDFYFDTLEMVKDGFVQEGREDVFHIIATQIALTALADGAIRDDENEEDQPCIPPSDVL
jgi:hypothetical protein